MSDSSQNPDPAHEVRSHLKTHLVEVMAACRSQAMHLLVEELLIAFAQERYQVNEFIDALAYHLDLQSGWEEIVKDLENASEQIVNLRRERGDLPR